MVYALAIILSMLLIALLNILFPGDTGLTPQYFMITVVLQTVMVIVFDGITAFLIRRMPKRFFHYSGNAFNIRKKEILLYRKLKIKSWKDYILELGCFTNFSKRTLSDPSNPEYTERFLLESCYGIIIHIGCVFAGAIIVLLYPASVFFRISLPIVLVNAVLNILPMMILRFNLPMLNNLHRRNLRILRTENIPTSTGNEAIQ